MLFLVLAMTRKYLWALCSLQRRWAGTLIFKRCSHLSVSTVRFLPKGFWYLSYVSIVNVSVTDQGNEWVGEVSQVWLWVRAAWTQDVSAILSLPWPDCMFLNQLLDFAGEKRSCLSNLRSHYIWPFSSFSVKNSCYRYSDLKVFWIWRSCVFST